LPDVESYYAKDRKKNVESEDESVAVGVKKERIEMVLQSSLAKMG
jgi:hypothetical protein